MSYYALTDSDWSWDDEAEGRAIVVHADTPQDAVRIATEKHIAENPGAGGICWKVARLWNVGFQMVDWEDDNKANFDRFDYYPEGSNEPLDTPSPKPQTIGRWLPIAQADKAITDVQEFAEVGITIKTSDRYWVRDDDGRVYEAAWSDGENGHDYWWDFEGESPVDPVEFMPHPLDPRYAAASEGKP